MSEQLMARLSNFVRLSAANNALNATLGRLTRTIEARDKDACRRIRAFIEALSEAAATPEKMQAFSELQKDPVKLTEMQAQLEKRYNELK